MEGEGEGEREGEVMQGRRKAYRRNE